MPEVSDSELLRIYRSKYVSFSNVRSSMVPVWTDIRDYMSPRTARFPGMLPNQGGREDKKIINSSPRIAIRTLASGMQSGVTSPMRPWFKLGTPDPRLQNFQPVKEWLSEVEQIMRDVFTRSNVYDKLKSIYGVLGTYGTSVLCIEDDMKTVLRGKDLPIGSFMLSTDETDRPNTLYRDTTLNPEQMIGKFCDGDMAKAKKILPSIVLNSYDRGNYDFYYPVTQIIEPNRNFKPGSAIAKYKKYASVWCDMGQGSFATGSNTLGGSYDSQASIFKTSGYDDIPFMGTRWDTLGEDIYGYGCGEMALGDSKQGQLLERRKLQGIDKNTDPAKIADASMRNQRISSMPGSTTYVNGLITGNPGVQAMYRPNPYITELSEEIRNVFTRIDDCFFKNLFLMVSEMADQPDITATQINALREEKLLMLGPVLERLNDELLDPLISITFGKLLANNMLPPPPKEIQGQPLRVEYVSILAQAQKALGLGNIERFVGFVGQLAEQQMAAQQPVTAWDKVNTDDLIDRYADGVALPPTGLNNDDVIAQMRQNRQKQTQAAQAMQMAHAGAQTAKTASQADLTTDSPLSRALQTAGATP